MSGKRQKVTPGRRFDVQALRDIAGGRVFDRGQAYQSDGRVEIAALDGERVIARIRGTETYRATLEGSGRRFSGECTCPAFFDFGFCKHLVAAALAANALSREDAQEIGGRFARLRNYLRMQGVEALVERLVALAERDPVLLEDLELASSVARGDDQEILSRFRDAVADAVSTGGYVEYAEAGGWASGIEDVLERIGSLAATGKAALALPLLEDFFDEMEDALGSVDDSDGHCGALIARASEIHLKACLAAKPDPIELARDLYAREVDSDWDFFHGASKAYSEVLGEGGLAEYRRLAEEAWKKVKPLHAGRRDDDDRYGLRFRLASILESFAQREGDLDARIAIRSKDLSSAYDYLGIAELCKTHGREADALKWAEEGLWQFEDSPDERLILFAAGLYVAMGRKPDGEKILWREFERSPSLDLYKHMKAMLGRVVTIRDRAVAFLRSKAEKPASRSSPRWAFVADTLVQLLSYEKLFDEAWRAAEQYGVSKRERMKLAQASEASHPAQSWKVLADHVEGLVASGGQRNYEDACKFLERIARMRAKLGEAPCSCRLAGRSRAPAQRETQLHEAPARVTIGQAPSRPRHTAADFSGTARCAIPVQNFASGP
jgi:hypothetical protein